ncbi:hypothetical protein [Nocardia bovistercoris]|uniref:Uncharacterized protein n=1 Tax=Nocardia bovistercoris TaxID=2785916 RepID=A0A931I9Y5_9NOCA|nr:hypothetical protein [Nocardia bovistercoris]MBH0776580.1 hypothetical protein [Nocardia bovistercoris]
MAPGEQAGWLPVVWGRTRRADTWWRVLPAALDSEGWIGEAVYAVFAGGRDLERPRFTLCRSRGWWLTGVACAAADLDSEMHTDENGRPLFTFVGWLHTLDQPAALPTLDQWERHRVEWARGTYARWCGMDWEALPSDVSLPHESVAEPVGWSSNAPALDGAVLRYRPGRAELRPDSERYTLWQAGTRSREPFLLVVGWSARQSLKAPHCTHATVADLSATVIVQAQVDGLDLDADDRPSADTAAVVPFRPPAPSPPAPASSTPVPTPPAPASTARQRNRWLGLIPGTASARDLEQLEQELTELREQYADCRREIAMLRDRLERGERDLAALRARVDGADPDPTSGGTG